MCSLALPVHILKWERYRGQHGPWRKDETQFVKRFIFLPIYEYFTFLSDPGPFKSPRSRGLSAIDELLVFTGIREALLLHLCLGRIGDCTPRSRYTGIPQQVCPK